MSASQFTPEDALQTLDRLLHYLERAAASEHKGELAGDSVTGARYRATALNWFAKAERAESELREQIAALAKARGER